MGHTDLMTDKKDILNKGIHDLFFEKGSGFNIDVRTLNCLIAENILTIGDLIKRTEVDLFRIPNFGRKSMVKVKDALTTLGLSLGTKPLIIKENIIYKDVEKERIVYKDKFVYQDKIIEKTVNVNVERHVEVPALSKCIICNNFPQLKYINMARFTIICKNCNTQVNTIAESYEESLFPMFYKAINKWNTLGAHLVKKPEIEEVKND